MKEEQYPIIKKAWKIKVDDLVEPWHYDDIIEYAETSNKAKYQALKDDVLRYAQIDDLYERDVEYKDIKARRSAEDDIVLYNSKEVRRDQISEILWVEERDKYANDVLVNTPNAICVVYAGCYNSWWGKNHCGYTNYIERAGKYTVQEACKIVTGSDYSRQEIVQVIDIDKYNSNINDQIIGLHNKIQELKGLKL